MEIIAYINIIPPIVVQVTNCYTQTITERTAIYARFLCYINKMSVII